MCNVDSKGGNLLVENESLFADDLEDTDHIVLGQHLCLLLTDHVFDVETADHWIGCKVRSAKEPRPMRALLVRLIRIIIMINNNPSFLVIKPNRDNASLHKVEDIWRGNGLKGRAWIADFFENVAFDKYRPILRLKPSNHSSSFFLSFSSFTPYHIFKRFDL